MKRSIFSLLILLTAICANAQRSAAPAAHLPIFLLNYPTVRKDLALSDSAARKIQKIQSESEKRYLQMLSPSASNPNEVRHPSQAQVQAETDKTEKTIVGLLNPKQKVRLRQIGYQYGGPFSIGEPEVAQALKITPAQKTKLSELGRKAILSFNQTLRSTITNAHVIQGKSDPTGKAKQLARARVNMLKALGVEVAKVLTPQQMSQWNQMQGKPFDVAPLYEPVVKRTLRG